MSDQERVYEAAKALAAFSPHACKVFGLSPEMLLKAYARAYVAVWEAQNGQLSLLPTEKPRSKVAAPKRKRTFALPDNVVPLFG